MADNDNLQRHHLLQFKISVNHKSNCKNKVILIQAMVKSFDAIYILAFVRELYLLGTS